MSVLLQYSTRFRVDTEVFIVLQTAITGFAVCAETDFIHVEFITKVASVIWASMVCIFY
jgi:hypothetical protein